MQNVVGAIDNAPIPRNRIIPSALAFTFKRFQFPHEVAFTLIIKKSPDETLQLASLYLENQCSS